MISKVVLEFSTANAALVNAAFVKLTDCSDVEALPPFLVSLHEAPDAKQWGSEIALSCKSGIVCCPYGSGWMFCMSTLSFIITSGQKGEWDVWVGIEGAHLHAFPDAILAMKEQDPAAKITVNTLYTTTSRAAAEYASAQPVA